MAHLLPHRISRWIREEGPRGISRKIKHLIRYLHLRVVILFYRKWAASGKAVPPSFPGGNPEFSVLIPAFRSRKAWLKKAVNSVRDQNHPNWELLIGLSEVTPEIQRYTASLPRQDARIRVLALGPNHGISSNCNLLAREAKGEFLAVLDHDDWLEPHALAEIASRASSADLIYTDEDVVSPRLELPSPPKLKPDWAPDTFRSYNYVCHFCCFRRSLFEEVGGFQSEYDGSQDYDLFLKLSERTKRIAHVRKVLYHWRRHPLSAASGVEGNAKPLAWDASRRALDEHLRRCGETAHAEFGHAYGTLRVRYARSRDPLVDILIPSMNRDDTLVRCLDSILALSRYPNYRVTVMLNGSANFTGVKSRYGLDARISFQDYREPFNFSRINNLAAADSKGEALIFLNDDIEITQGDWIEGMLEHALRKEIGAVGAMLLYPDRTIQHAGLCVDYDYIGYDFHSRLPETSGGYHFRAQTIQNVSAVIAACLCTRREVFRAMSGFDEVFPFAYNDVDFGLKLLAQCYRVVYTPYVRLIHHESLTRGHDLDGEKLARFQDDIRRMREKWGREGLKDRYFDLGFFKRGADVRRMARDYLAPPHRAAAGPTHD